MKKKRKRRRRKNEGLNDSYERSSWHCALFPDPPLRRSYLLPCGTVTFWHTFLPPPLPPLPLTFLLPPSALPYSSPLTARNISIIAF